MPKSFLKRISQSLLISLMLCATAIAKEPKELFWEDMVPPDYVSPPSEEAVMHEGIAGLQSDAAAPVIEALNNQHVKIPGFVVPLDATGETVSEFLLVPYFGACVHVPPPPSNQIVHVTFEEPISMDEVYDAVWIEGILTTESWRGDIAAVGYRLKGISVSPFEG